MSIKKFTTGCPIFIHDVSLSRLRVLLDSDELLDSPCFSVFLKLLLFVSEIHAAVNRKIVEFSSSK